MQPQTVITAQYPLIRSVRVNCKYASTVEYAVEKS